MYGIEDVLDNLLIKFATKSLHSEHVFVFEYDISTTCSRCNYIESHQLPRKIKSLWVNVDNLDVPMMNIITEDIISDNLVSILNRKENCKNCSGESSCTRTVFDKKYPLLLFSHISLSSEPSHESIGGLYSNRKGICTAFHHSGVDYHLQAVIYYGDGHYIVRTIYNGSVYEYDGMRLPDPKFIIVNNVLELESIIIDQKTKRYKRMSTLVYKKCGVV